jgi:hypothetical protein
MTAVRPIGADAQHAIDDCREQASLRREIWQVICDYGRYYAQPRSFDVAPEAVVGDAGEDGEFWVAPEWQERARAEGWW